jgi:hypothetical protein
MNAISKFVPVVLPELPDVPVVPDEPLLPAEPELPVAPLEPEVPLDPAPPDITTEPVCNAPNVTTTANVVGSTVMPPG